MDYLFIHLFLYFYSTGDAFRKPKPSAHAPCYIENIHINLPPSVETFEEELCRLLNIDRLNRDDKEADGTTVSVLERRLQVRQTCFSFSFLHASILQIM